MDSSDRQAGEITEAMKAAGEAALLDALPLNIDLGTPGVRSAACRVYVAMLEAAAQAKGKGRKALSRAC